MMEIRFDKTKDEVALLIWFLVDHSVLFISGHVYFHKVKRSRGTKIENMKSKD
jgi:hypothetical protein